MNEHLYGHFSPCKFRLFWSSVDVPFICPLLYPLTLCGLLHPQPGGFYRWSVLSFFLVPKLQDPCPLINRASSESGFLVFFNYWPIIGDDACKTCSPASASRHLASKFHPLGKFSPRRGQMSCWLHERLNSVAYGRLEGSKLDSYPYPIKFSEDTWWSTDDYDQHEHQF